MTTHDGRQSRRTSNKRTTDVPPTCRALFDAFNSSACFQGVVCQSDCLALGGPPARNTATPPNIFPCRIGGGVRARALRRAKRITSGDEDDGDDHASRSRSGAVFSILVDRNAGRACDRINDLRPVVLVFTRALYGAPARIYSNAAFYRRSPAGCAITRR